MKLEGWNILDDSAAIAWREYSFTKGAYATTLAFRGADGLVVVSPGCGEDSRSLDALAELGPVRALVANNGMHHLGQRAWRQRFPEAQSYCPPAAMPRLAKRDPLTKYRPLSELALPKHAQIDDPPGFKSGEAIARVESSRGSVWFTGDFLINMRGVPKPPLRWIFTLTNSAPGFRLFRLATLLTVRDKSALREWALAQIDAAPPAVIVPGHGPAYDVADLAEQARTQIRRL